MRRAGKRLPAALLALSISYLIHSPAGADPPPMSREEFICRAEAGVGFSYWWGGECWCASGCSPEFSCGAGGCTGSCPDCTHTGEYGADCSGYVSKIWQVPNPNPVEACHVDRYRAVDFTSSSSFWNVIDRSSVEPGDALASSTHVMLYESGDPWGTPAVFEAKGCSYGIVYNTRSVSSSYVAARRIDIVPSCTPSEEICDGLDNDCDGTADNGNPGGGAPCGSDVGECAAGVIECTGGSLVCAGEILPAVEACDGLDNDCNGVVDDGCPPDLEEPLDEVEPAGEAIPDEPDAAADYSHADAAPDGPIGWSEVGLTGGCGCGLVG